MHKNNNKPSRILARKRFGQNFLQDTHIIQNIIQVIHPQSHQAFVEIGPGRGALTFPLLKSLKSLTDTQLIAIEIDRDLITFLSETAPKLKVIEADALAFDYSQLVNNALAAENTRKLRVYGNLPYNISTPLLIHLLHFVSSIQDCHFMVQKEVAERICAPSGNKDYGRLSVMMQYYFDTDILFGVPPESFFPKPKVDSSIIRLMPHAISPYSFVPFEKLEFAVKQGFAHRRKTLRNNFKGFIAEKDWEILEIDPQLRPEQISIEKFVKLAQFMLY